MRLIPQTAGFQILVVKDSKSKAAFAHVVPQKGVYPKRYVVDMTVEHVLWRGLSQALLKTDDERPIAKVSKESLSACKVAGLDQVGGEPPRHMTSRPTVLLRVPFSKCKVA